MVLAENVEETEIPGGALVLSEEMPHVASVTLGVWFRSGSRHEGPGEEGLTHFLEHMFFKGTARRSARLIAEELDAVGGHLDASTGRETTCIFSRVMAEHLPLACDVLSDIICHSVFAEDDVEREKGVVLEEVRSYEDEPAEMVMDNLLGVMYGDHPLARPILGDPSVIRGISGERVRAYRERFCGVNRVVVSAAGQIRHPDLLDMMGPLLKGLPAGMEAAASAPARRDARQRAFIREQEQVHLALAAPTFPFSHPARHVLQVLNNLLGGSVSSRLFQEIRERRGLAYAASSGLESFHDAGLVSLHTAADPGKYGEITSAIRGVLEDLAGGGVSDGEVARAREQIKGSIFLALESTANRMSRLALSRIYLGRVAPLAEVLAEVEAVGPEAVRDMAVDLLGPGRFSLAALGPGSPERYRVPWIGDGTDGPRPAAAVGGEARA